MKRQAATIKGLQRRLRDAQLDRVTDPRVAGKVTYSLRSLLGLFVTAAVTGANTLRAIEARSEAFVQRLGAYLATTQRVADNTFSTLLGRLAPDELIACLHRLVKAEHRRGNLAPVRLRAATVAVDGKNVATLRWHDLCRALHYDEGEDVPVQQVRQQLAQRFPEAQLCVPERGTPYALVRVHTVTLVSSDAPVCIHQRAIVGHTNEVGSMPALIDELGAAYGRTRILERVTCDAGNTSLAAARRIVAHGWEYFAQIKSIHRDLYGEAVRALAHRGPDAADATYADAQRGHVVDYALWRYDLGPDGWLDWTCARQLIRIQRTQTNPTTGEVVVGNRYYVSSEATSALSADEALRVARGHWRCENELHWTADTQFGEDLRRLTGSRHPTGVLVVSALRRIAAFLVALGRALSRTRDGQRPPWRAVLDAFAFTLCAPTLDLTAFDRA